MGFLQSQTHTLHAHFSTLFSFKEKEGEEEEMLHLSLLSFKKPKSFPSSFPPFLRVLVRKLIPLPCMQEFELSGLFYNICNFMDCFGENYLNHVVDNLILMNVTF